MNTGSGMKDGKLRSKDFFNAKDDPYITFHSTKIVQTGRFAPCGGVPRLAEAS